MKNAKKPTRDQRKAIIEAGLNAEDWRIVRIFTYELEVVNIKTQEVKRIAKV